MVLILLGTQKNSFHRLLEEVEKNIINGIIKDEVIVQAGFTKFCSDNMKIFDLLPKDDLSKLVDKADLIITHSGIGSITMALNKEKKVIAIPRKKMFGEHINDHQQDITNKFNEEGYLIGIDSVSELKNAIIKSTYFIPKKYVVNSNLKMINLIKTYIENL